MHDHSRSGGNHRVKPGHQSDRTRKRWGVEIRDRKPDRPIFMVGFEPPEIVVVSVSDLMALGQTHQHGRVNTLECRLRIGTYEVLTAEPQLTAAGRQKHLVDPPIALAAPRPGFVDHGAKLATTHESGPTRGNMALCSLP